MDKPEILERIRKALSDPRMPFPGTVFTSNTLHGIENALVNDIAAEEKLRTAVVVGGKVGPPPTVGVERLQRYCRHLRLQRDLAREHIVSQRAETERIQRELASAREHCGRARDDRDKVAAEFAALKKTVRPPSDYSDMVTTAARLRNNIATLYGSLNTVIDERNAAREQCLLLCAENEGLESDLRKCQVELAEAKATDRRRVDQIIGLAKDLDAAQRQPLTPIESETDRFDRIESRLDLMFAQFVEYSREINSDVDGVLKRLSAIEAV